MKSSDVLLLILAIALVIGMILTAMLGKEKSKHGYGAVDGAATYASISKPYKSGN